MTADTEVEDVKPKLNLTIVYGEASVRLQAKANTPFKRIFEAAYKRFNLQPGSVKFIHEGNRIRDDDTPGSVGLEDEDQIDAHVEQQGGRHY